ncbi:hypothetical protein [Spirulina subsalsa]|nr:hypothetical protein [Spirulina subsalsa]
MPNQSESWGVGNRESGVGSRESGVGSPGTLPPCSLFPVPRSLK